MWVRASDDVLLVARPWHGDGQVLSVVRGRFAPTGEAAPDTGDYRRAPLSYRLEVAQRLLLVFAATLLAATWLMLPGP